MIARHLESTYDWRAAEALRDTGDPDALGPLRSYLGMVEQEFERTSREHRGYPERIANKIRRMIDDLERCYE